jgi:hypothetical protein
MKAIISILLAVCLLFPVALFAGSTTTFGLYKPAVGELNYGTAMNANWDTLDMLMQGWAQPAWTLAYVNSTHFTIAGDKTDLLSVGQVIYMVDGSAAKTRSVVKTRGYNGGTGLTTITVWDANVPASLSYIQLAAINVTDLIGVDGNTKLGYNAGTFISTGALNFLGGYTAGYSITTGSENVMIGYNAGYWSSGGNYCTLLGPLAGYHNGGDYNVALGYKAGNTNSSGNNNVYLGAYAGYYETGSSKLFIDNAQRASEADGRVKALVYGNFDASPVNQFVQINGFLGVYKGGNVTAAATIVPTGAIFHVTGTTQTTLIAIPYAGWTGSITVIPDNTGPTWTTATGGAQSGLNYPLRLATTAVQYKAITFTFDGTYWYPSY